MKTIRCYLTILSSLLICNYSCAQNVCDSFDDCVIDSTNGLTIDSTRDHAFNTLGNGNAGCLSNWEVGSGTPSLWDNTAGLADGFGTAYNGTRFALLGVCGDFYPSQWTDAILYKYNFNPGNTYTVSMAIRTCDSSNFIDIQYVLLQNSLNYQYSYHIGCSQTPDIPTGGLIVDSIMHFGTAYWQKVSFTITNLTDTFNRLWIRPLIDQNVSVNFCIDSFCISQPKSTAIENVQLSEPVLLKAMPNPFTDGTKISYALPPHVQAAQIVVTNLLGQIVRSYPIVNSTFGSVNFDSGGLKPGLYICTLMDKDKVLASQKLVIIR